MFSEGILAGMSVEPPVTPGPLVNLGPNWTLSRGTEIKQALTRPGGLSGTKLFQEIKL